MNTSAATKLIAWALLISLAAAGLFGFLAMDHTGGACAASAAGHAICPAEVLSHSLSPATISALFLVALAGIVLVSFGAAASVSPWGSGRWRQNFFIPRPFTRYLALLEHSPSA